MGWLWSSTPAQAPSQPAQESSTNTAPFTPEPTFSDTPQPKPLSRDELAEKELHSFLAELSADTKPSSTKYNRVPKAASPGSASKPESTSSDDPNLPLSEQLLPTYMSCRTAFDEAFYCNSFGGKFNDLYRYGGLESCSGHWNKFWFCMRTRTWSEPEKKEAIRDYYRKVEAAKYGRGKDGQKALSSESIWKSRERKVPVKDGGFNKIDPEKFVGTDEEWNKVEQERRRNRVIELSRGTVT